MRKRPILLILTACTLLALFAFAFSRLNPEPAYHGKPLSQWLRLYSACLLDTDPLVRLYATNALLKIAPEALTNTLAP